MTQHYVGTKIVVAWAQAGKDGAPGYAIKYPDGYMSWSPKEVFEEAYIALGHLDQYMPHEQRVFAEHIELNARTSRLSNFIMTEGSAFYSLPDEDRSLLEQQCVLMEELLVVTGKQVERLRRKKHDENNDGA